MQNQDFDLDSIALEATSELEKVLKSKNMGAQLGSSASRRSSSESHRGSAKKQDHSDEEGDFTIQDLLSVMNEHSASDLHIKEGAPPMVRIDGDLYPIGETKLTARDCERLIFSACSKNQQAMLAKGKTIDFAYSFDGIRYRANAFLQKSTYSASIRMIRVKVPTLEEMHLPSHISSMLDHKNGLVLVTGPAGSGKSTTLAVMIDYINERKPLHIVTIEDPIEYYHAHKKSLITQREIGADTNSFEAALKYSLRQDPNVILIGEMRDPDTIMIATRAAETGHLVLSTLHTPNCVQAISRMLDVFTGENRKQMRLLLANNLRGVLSQRLIPTINGDGRVPAVEIMIITSTISSLILDGNVNEIYPYIQDGKLDGMQTMNQSLLNLYESGFISYESALAASDQSTELRMLIEGHTTSFTSLKDQQDNNADDDTLMSWI
jgi:twitching motility protein PilT